MRTPRLMLIGVVAAMMLALPAVGVARSQGTKDRAHAGAKRHHKKPLADRNRDRIPDRWERKFRLSLRVNQANRDQDRDHMRNLVEFRTGNNPRDADTDNDGVDDNEENAGKIVSFENGILTISLVGGDQLVGAVTDSTEIECKAALIPPPSNEPPVSGASLRHSGEDDAQNGDQGDGDHPGGPGDPSSGPGSPDSGSGDNGGHGSDSGDAGGSGPEDGDEVACTSADLVPGTPVHEADVETTTDGAVVFTKLELLKSVEAVGQAPQHTDD